MRSRSLAVLSAENAIRQVVLDVPVLNQYYPDAATRVIPLLFQGIELLLSDYLWNELGDKVDNSEELINIYAEWEEGERELVDWLRRERNQIIHEGESFEIDQKEYVVERIKRSLRLFGKLYKTFGFNFEDQNRFSTIEVKLISNQKLEPDELPLVLIDCAVRLSETESESTVMIANDAYDKTLRYFAQGWWGDRFEDLNTRQLRELLEDRGSGDSDPLIYYDRRTPSEPLSEFIQTGIDPPMEFHELTRSFSSDPPNMGVKSYVHELREIIVYDIWWTPLEAEDCIKSQWYDLRQTMQSLFSDIYIPEIDVGNWMERRYFFDKTVSFPNNTFKSTSDYWTAEQERAFLREVENRCGPLPKGVRIQY